MKKVLLKSIFCLGIAFSSNFGICAITIENFSLNLEKYKGNLDIAQKKIKEVVCKNIGKLNRLSALIRKTYPHTDCYFEFSTIRDLLDDTFAPTKDTNIEGKLQQRMQQLLVTNGVIDQLINIYEEFINFVPIDFCIRMYAYADGRSCILNKRSFSIEFS